MAYKNPYDSFLLDTWIEIQHFPGVVQLSPSNIGMIDLDLISVFPEYRSQGYATFAMSLIMAHLDQYKFRCRLVVKPQDSSTTNDGLVRLYERHGFRLRPMSTRIYER